MWDKISKLFKQLVFSQRHSTMLLIDLNHLEGREVEKWGLWLQREWGLMLGKVEGGEM